MIARKQSKETRILELLRNGVRRKEVAEKIGTTLKYVSRLAAHHRIANGGGEIVSRSSAGNRGPYTVAAKRLKHHDLDVATIEVGRLFGVARSTTGGDVPDSELKETAEALGVDEQRIRDLWKSHWRKDAARIRENDCKVDSQMDGYTPEERSQLISLTDEERAWTEVGEDNETEEVIVGAIHAAAERIRDIRPRQPADPRKRMIEFALRVIGCRQQGNLGHVTFTDSTDGACA